MFDIIKSSNPPDFELKKHTRSIGPTEFERIRNIR
jgi:hypothetical protein